MLGLLQMLHNLNNKLNINPPPIKHHKYSTLWSTTTVSNFPISKCHQLTSIFHRREIFFSRSIADVWYLIVTPPSAFLPVLTMHSYRPTMLSMRFDIPCDDNEVENNDDDSSPPLRHPPRQ